MHFPLARIRYFMRQLSHAHSIGDDAVLACAIAIEIILLELFQVGCELARRERYKKLHHRHVLMAIKYSPWLSNFFRNT